MPINIRRAVCSNCSKPVAYLARAIGLQAEQAADIASRVISQLKRPGRIRRAERSSEPFCHRHGQRIGRASVMRVASNQDFIPRRKHRNRINGRAALRSSLSALRSRRGAQYYCGLRRCQQYGASTEIRSRASSGGHFALALSGADGSLSRR